jgi:hypothetical protein
LSENAQTRSVTNWERAPKDGSLINVEFSGDEVIQARWDLDREYWKVPRSDGDIIMLHGESYEPPSDWWPVI